ncbi:MAG: hypothetical protein R2939_06815 [Kofleriaceae bacterium]
MVFRTEDRDGLARTEAQERARDDLDRIAAEGKERAAMAAAKTHAARSRELARASRHERARVREAVLGGSRLFMGVVFGGVLLGAAPLMLLATMSDPAPWMVAAAIAWLVLGIGVAWGSRYVIGARAIAAQERKLMTLGFPVDGFFRVLGVDPSDGKLTLTIELRTSAPARDTLEGLAGVLDARLDAVEDRKVVFVSQEISTDGGDGPSHNREFHAWLARAIDAVLVPTHRGYPLARVRVDRR